METLSREERIVRNVEANLRIEDFHVTEQTRADCLAIAAGKKSASELVTERLSQYTMK